MKVGVLALQGDVREHLDLLRPFVAAVPVRTAQDLESVDALVLPGGETTTLSGLLERSGLLGVLDKRLQSQMPAFGTCAGAILLASEVTGGEVPHLSAVDITVRRNGYGRQVDSFETDVEVAGVGPVHAVFIRAPIIDRVGGQAQVLSSSDGSPTVVRQGAVLVCTFHPELMGDDSLHRFFVEEICSR